MTKASQLAAKLNGIEAHAGINMVEAEANKALHFDVIDDVMCIMHSDGSVNLIGQMGAAAMMVETIAPHNILKVLKHYRPFKDVFKDQVQ